MWPLLDSVLVPEMPMKDKLTYLNLVNHVHKLRFRGEADINRLKERIQELISSPITRFEGYLVLDSLMTNHPETYIHNWGPIIIGSLKCSDSYVSKQLTLRILRRVVVNFSANTSCSDAFTRFIPEILPMLLETDENDYGFVYCIESLAICMQHMPAILGPHSDEIEVFLMKHVDSAYVDVVEAIADCFAALPICVTSFQRPHPCLTDVWLEVYLKTLNTLQALLNDVFKFPEVENSLASVDDLPLFKIEFDPNEKEVTYVLKRIRIFSALCICLAKMMSKRFESNSESTRVKVPVLDLLQCLERIFQVKGIIKLKDKRPMCSAFLLIYPVMQMAVLAVLEALIVNFTIIEQSGNFAKLLKESVEATTSTAFEESLNSVCQVRAATWKTLNTWLMQYGAKGSYEIVNDRFLIKELLIDVVLEESENGHPPANETNRQTEQSEPVDYRIRCTSEALQALQNIFTTGGSYIERGLADDISTTLLCTVQRIQKFVHPSKKFPYPYTNVNCRLKLYDSLLSGSLFGDPLQTKFVNQAITMFKIASRDSEMEINTICHRAFQLCRCFLNPKKIPPEASLERIKAVPPPLEENVQTGWESSSWSVINESSQEEKSMDVTPPPCQIETVYHNSVESDGQRDLSVQNTKSPIHYSEAHASQSQCNGNSSRLVSNKPPSHSNVCNDSESEVEEYKDFSVEEPHVMSVDIPPISPTPIINSVESQISEPKITNLESKIIELKPLEPVIAENIATTNHRDSSVADASVKCIEDVDEIVPQKQPLKRMAENGMDVESEDEESGDEEDEEGTGSDEDEEANENYLPEERYSPEFYHHEQEVVSDRCSPDYYHERPVKRRKISNEEEHSSDDYEEEKSSNQNQEMNQDEESEDEEGRQSEDEEEMPNGSPTVSEMCRDFVLAEPEEIS